MLRRFIRWLIGIPSGSRLAERSALAAERDRAKTAAIAEASRGNWTGKGPGTMPRDMP